jgi:hypothetical protein
MAGLFCNVPRYYLIAPDGELVAEGVIFELIAHYQQMYDHELYVGRHPPDSMRQIIASSLWPIFLAGAIWMLVLLFVTS